MACLGRAFVTVRVSTAVSRVRFSHSLFLSPRAFCLSVCLSVCSQCLSPSPPSVPVSHVSVTAHVCVAVSAPMSVYASVSVSLSLGLCLALCHGLSLSLPLSGQRSHRVSVRPVSATLIPEPAFTNPSPLTPAQALPAFGVRITG
eukprot:136628-Rhodomonas_salina.1